MSYKYIFLCLFAVSLRGTSQHFVKPPVACILEKICNHSGVALCGLERNKKLYRLFLDECDLYEYNCDNKEDYENTDMKNCEQLSKTKQNTLDKVYNLIININQVIISLPTASSTLKQSTCKLNDEKLDTSTQATSILNQEITSNSSQDPSTGIQTISTLVPKITTLNEEIIAVTNTKSTIINETVIPSTSTFDFNVSEIINNDTLTDKYLASSTTPYYYPTTRSTEANGKTITTEKFTTTDVTRIRTDFVLNITSDNVKTTVQDSLTTQTLPTIIPNSTKSKSPSTSKSNPTNLEITTVNDKSSLIYTLPYSLYTNNNTESSLTGIQVTDSTKNMRTEQSITEKITCSLYPSYCNRPKVWVTTAKGEKRDFFQILKARFGRRATADIKQYRTNGKINFNANGDIFRGGSHIETFPNF